MEKDILCRRLGTMVDCSRNAVMRPEKVEEWIDLTASLGYNCLMLYTEDTYEIDGEPYFGHLRGRYSQEELRHLDEYANAKGIELIPCIQTLAHLRQIFDWPAYQNGMRDFNDILMVGEERVYALIDKMFAMIHDTFRTKVVNIGMDEAHMLGRGRYLSCNGLRDRSEILMEHLNRISQIARKYDLELIMWGDMFFRIASGGEYYVDHVEISDKVKSMVPDNVNLIYWDYYSVEADTYAKQIRYHAAIKEGIWFAGGLWCWSGFAPHNTFALETMSLAMNSCLEYGLENIFMTMWGDNGGECSRFAMLPALYYVAQRAKGIRDMDTIKEGFCKRFGIPFDDYMLLDLPGTPNEKEKKIVNPDKYMLYSDCFMGKFDSRVGEKQAQSYGICAKKLEKWMDHPEYGHLFTTMQALCRVMEIKFDLGVRTRQAYLSGNREALQALTREYTLLEERVEHFYEVYREQWLAENKPFGFEVQDLRLGGLCKRIRHCGERLQAYLDGALDRIEELEAPVLDVRGVENMAGEALEFNSWSQSVTANVI